MDTLRPYIDSFIVVWKENSPAARVGIVLLAALCALAIAAIGYWSVQPNYVVLASEMEFEKLDTLIEEFEKNEIDYQLTGGGNTVMVDKRDYAKARQYARKRGAAIMEAESAGGFAGAFSSPSEQREQQRKRKERDLEQTIKMMAMVQHADVHLNIPRRGPFERTSSIPTASILLTLHPGMTLRQHHASSIASLVSGAVENMRPEDVQISDTDGASYTMPDEGVRQVNTQIAYRIEEESTLARKAENQLVRVLGIGNASVKVALDLTFTDGTKTTTKYDKEGKVASQESLHTETQTQLEDQAVGKAGTESNIRSTNRNSSASGIEKKTEDLDATYLVPITEETESSTTPIRNQMTVSVVVNSEAPTLKSADGKPIANFESRVAELVKSAVGFSEERGDVVTVEFLPFPKFETDELPGSAPFDWSVVMSIIEKSSLAVAALLALTLGFMLLKRVKPSSDEQPANDIARMDRERVESISRLSDMIKENPEVFSQVIRSWSGIDETDEERSEAA